MANIFVQWLAHEIITHNFKERKPLWPIMFLHSVSLQYNNFMEAIQFATLVLIILNLPLPSLDCCVRHYISYYNYTKIWLGLLLSKSFCSTGYRKVSCWWTKQVINFVIKLCIGHYKRTARFDLFFLSMFISTDWLVPVALFYKFIYPCFLLICLYVLSPFLPNN